MKERGVTQIEWDGSIDPKDLKVSDFKLQVSLRELTGELQQGEMLVVMSHETGLHLASYTKLLAQFKNGDINGDQLIKQLQEVELSDHQKIENDGHKTFNDLNKEIENLVGQSKISLFTGNPAEDRKNDLWLLPGTQTFDFKLNYQMKGVDITPNKNGVTSTFQSTKGAKVSLYNNYRFHRSEHNFDYSSENEDNMISE